MKRSEEISSRVPKGQEEAFGHREVNAGKSGRNQKNQGPKVNLFL
jgi:hypothetical protein